VAVPRDRRPARHSRRRQSRGAGRGGTPARPVPACGASESSPWLYGQQAAADYLGIPLATIQKLTAANAVPCYRDTPGGRLSFRRDELDRWLAEDRDSSS
jgi:excisionase family DNA binding protein